MSGNGLAQHYMVYSASSPTSAGIHSVVHIYYWAEVLRHFQCFYFLIRWSKSIPVNVPHCLIGSLDSGLGNLLHPECVKYRRGRFRVFDLRLLSQNLLPFISSASLYHQSLWIFHASFLSSSFNPPFHPLFSQQRKFKSKKQVLV